MPDLRLAIPEDIPGIRDLIDLSVRALSVGLYTPAQTEGALAHVFGVDSQLITDKTYYVIDNGITLLAAGGWSARRTLYGGDQAKLEIDSLLDPETMPARIRAFFVHPDFTRRGLARQILAECETAASARGFHDFELVATLPGVPFYSALGFTALEEVDVPLPHDEILPCLRMKRPIATI
jgi:GNAT superfamily N-acetyltransferase